MLRTLNCRDCNIDVILIKLQYAEASTLVEPYNVGLIRWC